MTREEELIRIAKKLDKMVSRNTTEGAVDLLRELKSFNMTLKLLQETRIGVSVNNIRKHCRDEEVITLAKVLIKDWKRLLDSGQPHSEKPSGMKNGLDSTQAAGSPSSSPSDTQSSHSGLDVKLKQDPDKNRKEKHNAEQRGKKRPIIDFCNEKHPEEPQNKKHPPEIRREKHPEESNKQRAFRDSWLQVGNKMQNRVRELQTEKHEPDERKERVKKGKHPEEPKSPDDVKRQRDENRHERLINTQQGQSPLTEPQRLKPTDVHRPLFERRGVLDSSILYPTRFPSPPRPPRPPLPIKRPSLDQKKDRKDGKDSFAQYPRPRSPPSSSTPPPRRPSMDVKKERRIPPDPNAPIAPLPLHLHPPPPRKEPPDPNAPLPPLPLHLHPPPPPKRPSVDERSESRRESSDSKPPSQKKKTLDHLKKDRKDLSYSTISKKHSDEGNRDRKDSTDTKPPVPKKLSEETQKEKHRKDSCDSKPAQIVKRHSADFKPDRRESADSKKSSSSPAKKLTAERRESHGSRTSQSGPPQRKLSTDSSERRAKPDVTKSPTTPTSPISPSFTSAGGSLPPHLTTGDSIRDKCIEMLAAALRTDDDYKEFSTNCENMAAEIEDHIYQEIKATDMKYKNRVRSRISNLKDPKNPGLRKNVLAGTIALSQIASMSAEEMASDELKQLRNTLTQEAIREHQMAKTGGTTTDLLQCSKCKKKNCTYNQVQTRSADEPMTTFVLCNECGNRWKFC